ncbi:MAG: NAD(P)-dependent oxidoreductase [Minisyncoccia bacterium]
MKKIAFLEITEWDKDYLKNFSDFSSKCDFFEEEISLNNVNKFSQYEIISIFINSKINKEILDNLSNLKLIVTRSTGFDHIDIEECKKRNILVCNVPEYGSHTVAEYTFGLILMLLRKLYDAYHQVRETGSFDLTNLRGYELYGKTLGVVGTGRIGKNVIQIANGFEMNVLAYDKYPNNELLKQLNFKYVSYEKLLQNSDIITFHVSYTPQTHHLLNKDNIKLVKKGAYIINTSRGGVIDTEALYEALKTKQIAGAALDVLEEEGIIKEEQELLLLSKNNLIDSEKLKITLLNHLFIDLDNVIITPHNAFNTEEGLKRIIETTIANIEYYLNSKPINLVK